MREEIHQLVRSALTLPDGASLRRVLVRLGRLSRTDCGTPRTPTMVREFLQGLHFYRAYRTHPELGLPHTTNTAESMGRLLRELFRSSRAGSTPDSVLLWATALIRLHPRLTCNGHAFNRKT